MSLVRMKELTPHLQDMNDILSPHAEIEMTRDPMAPGRRDQVHPRYDMELRVSVQTGTGVILKGQTLNLSNNGVGVAIPRRVALGTIVAVTLHLRRGYLWLPGIVVWNDEAPLADALGRLHGIKFRTCQRGTFAVDIFTTEHVLAE